MASRTPEPHASSHRQLTTRSLGLLAVLRAALAITDELGRNRDKIKATHDKVKSVNDLASRGGNIVGRMSARDKRQRTALLAAAGFIAFAILLLIYFGIFKK